MIAFNQNLNDAMRKGLLFAGADWLFQAVQQKQINCSVALAYSVKYQLEVKDGLAQLEEIPMFLN